MLDEYSVSLDFWNGSLEKEIDLICLWWTAMDRSESICTEWILGQWNGCSVGRQEGFFDRVCRVPSISSEFNGGWMDFIPSAGSLSPGRVLYHLIRDFVRFKGSQRGICPVLIDVCWDRIRWKHKVRNVFADCAPSFILPTGCACSRRNPSSLAAEGLYSGGSFCSSCLWERDEGALVGRADEWFAVQVRFRMYCPERRTAACIFK